MMSQIAISVTDLGKRYYIGGSQRQDRLTEKVSALVMDPLRRVGRLLRGQPIGSTGSSPAIWALRNINLEIQQGEVVGIIGRNGAGKSTLLKILSRITALTTGHAEIYGRVGSLLEVGTGFHLDLTGRENIYLNGAILGMKKAEIDRRFDEIVAFSEVEEFIDTPVKHYSSGMYMRLAFAVAAHLDTEILLVDEVLAVGDAEFQKKCLGKMGNLAQGGRTVLFVSHNLLAIEDLCERAIWLQQGEIAGEGAPKDVVSSYLRTSLSVLTERVWHVTPATLDGQKVGLHRVGVCPEDGSSADPITIHTPFRIEFEYWNTDPTSHLSVSFGLYNEHDVLVFDIASPFEPDWREKPAPAGLLRTCCHIPGDLINDGLYRISLIILQDQVPIISEPEALVFHVHDSPTIERGGWYGKWPGAIRPMLPWEVNQPLQGIEY
jgi:lipopolysaccharide transport system ATP-binding protein